MPLAVKCSVLPPPPRYPAAHTTINANGQVVTTTSPAAEVSNVLTHPTGPEFQLSVGEGTYVLRDSLQLAMPPPHPQDAPVVSTNPLATAPSPPKAGVKLSICITDPRKTSGRLYRMDTSSITGSNLGTYSIKEHERESRSSHDTSSDVSSSQMGHGSVPSRTPVFGEANIALTPAMGKDALKRKKPKTNLVKSNSQFISRVIPHENLTKRLQDHDPEGIFIFANIDRAYQWLDMSSPVAGKPGLLDYHLKGGPVPSKSEQAQPLMRILFARAHMLCHDINPLTKSQSHIDVIMGASTGDIVWFEAFSQKYIRINKGVCIDCLSTPSGLSINVAQNIISSSPVTEIRWLPGSENLFLASHIDGTLIVYDKERDDAAFTPEPNGTGLGEAENGTAEQTPLHINKSVNSKNQKSNPVASWRISNHKITGFAFSPDSRHLAVVSEDGSLRIINYLNEKLKDLYSSYYGAFLCVCWSPDGKYILTGGQDDLVSIWSLAERRIVARCPGHHSWVTAVAFDPWRCDGRNYRFGSVGEDCRLLLWDFNVGMLRRPKAASIRHRASVSSQKPVTRSHTRTESQATEGFKSTTNLSAADFDEDELMEHEVESRTTTATLPPVMVSLQLSTRDRRN